MASKALPQIRWNHTLDGRSTINFAVTICRLQMYLQIHKKQRDLVFVQMFYSRLFQRSNNICVCSITQCTSSKLGFFNPRWSEFYCKFKGTVDLSLVGLDVVVEKCCCSCFILILLLIKNDFTTPKTYFIPTSLPAYLQRQLPGGYIQIQSKRQKYPVNTKKH